MHEAQHTCVPTLIPSVIHFMVLRWDRSALEIKLFVYKTGLIAVPSSEQYQVIEIMQAEYSM